MANSVTRSESRIRVARLAGSFSFVLAIVTVPGVSFSADAIDAPARQARPVPLKLDGALINPPVTEPPSSADKSSAPAGDDAADSAGVAPADSADSAGAGGNATDAREGSLQPTPDDEAASGSDAEAKSEAVIDNSGGASADNALDAGSAPVPATFDSLQMIMAKVWRDNPQVTQAEEALRASGYDITAARAGYFPYLQVQSALANNSQDSVSTLYIVLPLWSGGSTSAQVDIAKAKQKAALAEVARVRLTLGQSVLQAYFSILQGQDQMIQWNNYISALDKLFSTIERRANQGLAPQADVETARSRLRQAQAGMEATRAALLTNRAQLSTLLNATPGSLSWPDAEAAMSDEQIAASGNRIELHPTHLAARAQIDIQEGTAHYSRAALWPEVSVQNRRQLDGVKFDPSNDATLLVFSFQSNNGVQGLFGYKAEKQRLDAVKAQLTAADRDIDSTVQVDRTQLRGSAAQLEVQDEAAASTTALVESYLRQFEAGRKSWLEVLNAQREANDNLMQSIVVRKNYWYATEKLALDSMQWERLGARIVSDTGKAVAK